MKTKTTSKAKTQKQSTGLVQELESRPEQFTTHEQTTPPAAATGSRKAYVDYRKRHENRKLGTDRVLALLRRWMPRQFELSEVVGSWVWVRFTDKQPAEITAQLSQFGFHWNNKRQAWQHPCGLFRKRSFDGDPRERYASYFPADHQTA